MSNVWMFLAFMAGSVIVGRWLGRRATRMAQARDYHPSRWNG